MDTILNILARSFLVFSDAIVISPLLIFGFISLGGFFILPPSKKGVLIWGYATVLILFTMIFNALLKSIFQIPLNPALGINGFAFPSGHMQVSVVFYGWLIMNYGNQILRSCILFMLIGMGCALIQQGYHDIIDVVGAIVFGIATLYAFAHSTVIPSIRANPPRMGLYLSLYASLMAVGIYILIDMPSHIPKTLEGLIAFTLLWWGLDYMYHLHKDKL